MDAGGYVNITVQLVDCGPEIKRLNVLKRH